MVIRLSPPDYNDEDIITQIVKERQNGKNSVFFTTFEPQWKSRLGNYIANGGNPEKITPDNSICSVANKKKFLTLYNSPQEESIQKPILKDLRERTLQYCPACGEDGTPNTLDHYLPKDLYPEFAVTTKNLFPMCDICQGKKSVGTLNNDGERLFLHPYFDDFLDEQVIQLNIGEPYSSPRTIEVVAHENIPPLLQELVNRHLDKLEVQQRFYHFFRSEYIRLLKLADDIRQDGLNMRQQINIFKRNAHRKSINSWGHVFYESVLRNNELVYFLETQP